MTRLCLLPILVLACAGIPATAGATELADQDAWMIQESAQESLEKAKTHQTTEWVNPDTGSSGSITPLVTYQNDDGQNCREYQQTVTIGGVQQQAYGTACRQPDGTWAVQRSEPIADSPGASPSRPPPPPPQAVYPDRVVYQPAPVPCCGYPVIWPFALSVGIGFGFYDAGWYGYLGSPYYGFARYGGYRAGYWRPGYRAGYYRGWSHGHRSAAYHGYFRSGYSHRGGHHGGGSYRSTGYRGGRYGGASHGRSSGHGGGHGGGYRR